MASEAPGVKLSRDGRPIRYGPYPEITWPAILVGYVVGALIAISIGYLSLKLGFSIEGSELAAILGFGVLRGVMRRKSIIENNIQQTLASGVNGASAGMMFSLPAIFILGYTDFNKPLVVLGCMAGGILGIAFIIPLRKQMIDFDRLAYPGGIATAAVLKTPGAGLKKAQLLLGAGLFA
ncbi:MAG: OPT/YSL family transporter, partial [Acidobacteriota bacterium]